MYLYSEVVDEVFLVCGLFQEVVDFVLYGECYLGFVLDVVFVFQDFVYLVNDWFEFYLC